LSYKTLRLIYPFAAAIFSGTLLTFAFPKYDLGWIGWFAIVPLLISILGRNAWLVFFTSLIFGVTFFTGVFSWIFDVPGYKIHHHFLLGLYFGPLMGLFGLTVNRIARRWNTGAALLATPFVWVSFEFIRSNLSFLALPWALLGHSQFQYPLLIQIASYTGAYGISFLIAFANAALAAVVLSFFASFEGDRLYKVSPASRKTAISMLLATVAFAGLTLLYGNVILSQPINGQGIKTSVLQGNIDQKMKGNPKKHSRFIMQKYTDLTRQALKDQPELIVWPEAATPGFVLKNTSLYQQTTSLVKEAKTYFLIGSSEYPNLVI